MTQNVTVHARMDRETKTSAEATLQKIGLRPTDAIRLLYRQISQRGEFPLELRVPNAETAETLEASDRGEGIIEHESVDAMFESWDRE